MVCHRVLLWPASIDTLVYRASKALSSRVSPSLLSTDHIAGIGGKTNLLAAAVGSPEGTVAANLDQFHIGSGAAIAPGEKFIKSGCHNA